MTKKGKSKSNVGNGVVIDTLVILSGDLVQVVAKVRYYFDFFYFVSLLIYLMLCRKNCVSERGLFIQGVQLSVDGVAGNMAGDCTEAVVGIVPSEHPVSEANKSTKYAIHKKKINQTRYSHIRFTWTEILLRITPF